MKELEVELSNEPENWNEIFYYDETSPSCLRWKIERRCGKGVGRIQKNIGDIAGGLTSRNYWSVCFKEKQYQVHSIILQIYGENLKGKIIDHIDGNPSNNKLNNLRVINQKENCRNSKKRTNNTSGFAGVVFNKSKVKGVEVLKWYAIWYNLEGKRRSKCFSVRKYGHDLAFTLACEYRKGIIEQLNNEGAGYTNRHGI